LAELKSIVAKGQYQAYKAVDNIKVQTYWQIGERIVREELKQKDRAGYSEYLFDNLTVDLGIARRDFLILIFIHCNPKVMNLDLFIRFKTGSIMDGSITCESF